MFYKIEENGIKMCPQNGELKDGTAISNYTTESINKQ